MVSGGNVRLLSFLLGAIVRLTRRGFLSKVHGFSAIFSSHLYFPPEVNYSCNNDSIFVRLFDARWFIIRVGLLKGRVIQL